MTEHNEELLDSVAEEIGQRVSPDIHGDLMGVEDAAGAILDLDFVATIRAQARREAFIEMREDTPPFRVERNRARSTL